MSVIDSWGDTIGALCCECGSLREVARYANTTSGNRVLKCVTCGGRTMHALVIGPTLYNDWREDACIGRSAGQNLDQIYDKQGTQPPLPTHPGGDTERRSTA